jgi:leucyl aminopeptidase
MIKLTTLSYRKSGMEMLALPVCEDADIHVDPLLQEILAQALALEEFSGEPKQQVVLFAPQGSGIKRCLCSGVGAQKTVDDETLRRFAGRAVKNAMAAKLQRLIFAVPSADALDMPTERIVKAIGEGACLANHIFGKYKAEAKQRPLGEILLRVEKRPSTALKALVRKVEIVCTAAHQAREWVSTPSNDKVPAQLAAMVTKAARRPGLRISVMDEAQLKKKKFGALLAVSVGSAHPPKLVEISYSPKSPKKTIVLVGKGVTFDTGGVNLKPSSGLERMKIDMAGAAAVAATMIAVSKLKPKHRVVGVMPLVENMVSGSAIRPGDIVRSYSGKTVEIGNTDAEGRLILADAMAYAIKKYQPHTIIDLATLTGACIVGLGDKIAGVFSLDETLSDTIAASGQRTHERCWPMPLPEDYKKLLKSDLADINNMPSTRYGGAITAALFLSEFVGDSRWAHIDIAGPVFDKKGSDYCGPGATGFGVRLLCDVMEYV